MVASRAWLPELRHRARLEDHDSGGGEDALGILAFEAAATMTRLLSIHRSLSDVEVLRLRSDTMRSPGVAYLVSTDQSHLLRLACAEVMDDLDRAAGAVSRLAAHCRDPLLRRFQRLYTDLVSGCPSSFPSDVGRLTDKRAKKAERLVFLTARLGEEMEAGAELEAAEKRIFHPAVKKHVTPASAAAYDVVAELKSRRHRVRRLKEESLWSVSSDKAVHLMARVAVAALARACAAFGGALPGLLPAAIHATRPRRSFKFASGPIERRPVPAREVPLRNSCPIPSSAGAAGERISWAGMLSAGAGRSVGAGGLSLRYADVIAAAERMLEIRGEGAVGPEERREEAAAREEVYAMLPAAVRAAVRGKLRNAYAAEAAGGGKVGADGGLAEGWREAVERIMRWLGPMARDTRRWQTEHSLDRRQRYGVRPRVMLIQTLHFADREKTEAAIVEVLVGLSCVYWYDDRRQASPIRC